MIYECSTVGLSMIIFRYEAESDRDAALKYVADMKEFQPSMVVQVDPGELSDTVYFFWDKDTDVLHPLEYRFFCCFHGREEEGQVVIAYCPYEAAKVFAAFDLSKAVHVSPFGTVGVTHIIREGKE